MSAVRSAPLELGPDPGIVGAHFEYVITKGDTLGSIRARFAVSENALIRDNRLKAPYHLRAGDRLQVQNRHLVPQQIYEGIVINLPQRLLFVYRQGRLAGAYAVAAGRPTWETPTGRYFVHTLEKDKPWIVPPSIQAEMRAQGKRILTRVEAGPKNPLGHYWIGLSVAGYGIHGTNAPSSIYGTRTHGCIRVHPVDIEKLYDLVEVGLPVEIVYAHTLLARLKDGRIVAEVNPDVYGRGGDPLQLMHDLARARGVEGAIDWASAARVAKERAGHALDIGHTDAGEDSAAVPASTDKRVAYSAALGVGCDGRKQ